jgi:hypothetical protein
MIFVSVGLPGRFTQSCDAILVQLVSKALGSAELIATNTLDDLAISMIRTGASHLVMSSRQPSSRLRGILSAGGTRFMLTIEDARTAVADLMMGQGSSLADAIRAVSSSCAALLRCAELRGALMLAEDRHGDDLVGVAEAIRAHFDLAVDRADLLLIAENASSTYDAPDNVEGWWGALGEPARQAISGALDGYASYSATGSLGKFTWTRDLFLIGDAPSESPNRAIDITGRARCLLYGPYIALPPGSWTALVVVGCSKETVGMSFMLEIFAGSQLSRTTLQPAGGGVFEAQLGFVIDEANENPLEVRIFNERAAFDGRLGLGNVTLVSLPNAARETYEDFTATLGLT